MRRRHQQSAMRRLLSIIFVVVVLLAGCNPMGTGGQVVAQRLATLFTVDASQADMATVVDQVAPSTTFDDQAAAVQTVVDYYHTINQQRYEQAYQLWSRSGAASNQTPAQFRQGFANTVRVQLRIGSVRTKNTQTVVVPVALTAVVNDQAAAGGQKVQRFSGEYVVQAAPATAARPDRWRLASASIAVTTSTAPARTPVATIESFYAAINQREFAASYTTWVDGGLASKRSFAQFQQGYASTRRVKIEVGEPTVEGTAGTIYANVPILIVATNTNHSQQTFCGVYTLRRTNVPPFDQLGWSIARASIKSAANVQPGSAAARHLVSGGC